jgi:protein-S-isoprenylcysteine O-methyltransferase Ste14
MNLAFIWKVLYWGWFASEIFLVIRTRARAKAGDKLRDRGSLYILWGTISACMIAGIYVGEAFPPNLPGDKNIYRLIALGMLILGLIIRWWAIYTLGRSFSVNVALREGQHVVKKGLFSLVRHPSYLGMMIIFIATGLMERSYYSMAIILIPIFFALSYRIHVEEIALREGFGQEYIDYSKRTKRLIPLIY